MLGGSSPGKEGGQEGRVIVSGSWITYSSHYLFQQTLREDILANAGVEDPA
jgi:hypothetical protein